VNHLLEPVSPAVAAAAPKALSHGKWSTSVPIELLQYMCICIYFLVTPLLCVNFGYYLDYKLWWLLLDWVTLQGKTPTMSCFSMLQIVHVCLSYYL